MAPRRSLPIAAALAAWLAAWLVPADARATCHAYREGGKLIQCCSPPGGPVSCSERRDDRGDSGSPPPRWDEWDEARVGRWNTALAVGAAAGGTFSDGGRFTGLEARAGRLWRWEPDGDFVTKILKTFAMVAIGNELGAELRVASFAERDEGRWRSVTTLGVRVASHVSVHRFRTPPLLSALPELQLRFADDGSITPSIGFRVPFAIMLTRHVGLELQGSAFVHAGFGGHLGLLYRP